MTGLVKSFAETLLNCSSSPTKAVAQFDMVKEAIRLSIAGPGGSATITESSHYFTNGIPGQVRIIFLLE